MFTNIANLATNGQGNNNTNSVTEIVNSLGQGVGKGTKQMMVWIKWIVPVIVLISCVASMIIAGFRYKRSSEGGDEMDGRKRYSKGKLGVAIGVSFAILIVFGIVWGIVVTKVDAFADNPPTITDNP